MVILESRGEEAGGKILDDVVAEGYASRVVRGGEPGDNVGRSPGSATSNLQTCIIISFDVFHDMMPTGKTPLYYDEQELTPDDLQPQQDHYHFGLCSRSPFFPRQHHRTSRQSVTAG